MSCRMICEACLGFLDVCAWWKALTHFHNTMWKLKYEWLCTLYVAISCWLKSGDFYYLYYVRARGPFLVARGRQAFCVRKSFSSNFLVFRGLARKASLFAFICVHGVVRHITPSQYGGQFSSDDFRALSILGATPSASQEIGTKTIPTGIERNWVRVGDRSSFTACKVETSPQPHCD